MKLSEKIKEALREQQEINLSDPAVQKRLAAQWGYVPAGAQLAPDIMDAIIDDLQSQFDSEGITEHDSGDALIRLSDAIAAVEDNFAGAQPAPSFADAYQGAMEEVAIWKKRALEAEDLNRKFVAEINGPTYMGEPAQPAPIEMSITTGALSEMFLSLYGHDKAKPGYEWRRGWNDAIRQAMEYAQPEPSVPDGYKLVPIEPTRKMLDAGEDTFVSSLSGTPTSSPIAVYRAMLAAAPEYKPCP